MVRKAIVDYLEQNGIKQSFLAEKAKMTPQALNTALKGTRNITIDEYIRICNALGVPLDKFLSEINKAS